MIKYNYAIICALKIVKRLTIFVTQCLLFSLSLLSFASFSLYVRVNRLLLLGGALCGDVGGVRQPDPDHLLRGGGPRGGHPRHLPPRDLQHPSTRHHRGKSSSSSLGLKVGENHRLFLPSASTDNTFRNFWHFSLF